MGTNDAHENDAHVQHQHSPFEQDGTDNAVDHNQNLYSPTPDTYTVTNHNEFVLLHEEDGHIIDTTTHQTHTPNTPQTTATIDLTDLLSEDSDL